MRHRTLRRSVAVFLVLLALFCWVARARAEDGGGQWVHVEECRYEEDPVLRFCIDRYVRVTPRQAVPLVLR